MHLVVNLGTTQINPKKGSDAFEPLNSAHKYTDNFRSHKEDYISLLPSYSFFISMYITWINYSLQIECKVFVTGRTELTPACNASLDKTRPKQKLSASTHSYSPRKKVHKCVVLQERKYVKIPNWPAQTSSFRKQKQYNFYQKLLIVLFKTSISRVTCRHGDCIFLTSNCRMMHNSTLLGTIWIL